MERNQANQLIRDIISAADQQRTPILGVLESLLEILPILNGGEVTQTEAETKLAELNFLTIITQAIGPSFSLAVLANDINFRSSLFIKISDLKRP